MTDNDSGAAPLSPQPIVGPALTREEWPGKAFRWYRKDGFDLHLTGSSTDLGVMLAVARLEPGQPVRAVKIALDRPEERHSVAALCLYGQPFGFTKEDVEVVMLAAEMMDDNAACWPERLESLASRISALLPPEG